MHPRFNRALRVLLAADSLVLLAGASLAPIYAIFVEDIGGSLLDASFAVGAFALASGCTSLMAGSFTDKIKEQELIVVLGYAIIGFGFLLYLSVHSILTLLIVQAIIGFGTALYPPAFDALYSKHLNKKRAALQWSAWESMDHFSTALGAVTGGIIVTLFGFNILFLIMAFLSFGSALYIYKMPRNLL